MRGAELACPGAVAHLWSWGHSSGLMRSGRTLMQVRNCCRRGSKQELVNASFFCIKSPCRVEYFRFYIAGSRRTALLAYCVPLLFGAAAGQSGGHCCILCSGTTGSSLRGVEPGRALSMAVQRGHFCSLFCVGALQGVGINYKKKCKGITEILGCPECSHKTVTWRCSKALEDHPGPTCQAICKPF